MIATFALSNPGKTLVKAIVVGHSSSQDPVQVRTSSLELYHGELDVPPTNTPGCMRGSPIKLTGSSPLFVLRVITLQATCVVQVRLVLSLLHPLQPVQRQLLRLQLVP